MHILFLSDNFPPEINASASRPQALPGGQTIRLLLHGVAGESAEIVEREGVGRVFEPENVDQLVRHLLDMQGDAAASEGFRRNGLQAAQRYNRKALALQMLSVLDRVRAKCGLRAPQVWGLPTDKADA